MEYKEAFMEYKETFMEYKEALWIQRNIFCDAQATVLPEAVGVSPHAMIAQPLGLITLDPRTPLEKIAAICARQRKLSRSSFKS